MRKITIVAAALAASACTSSPPVASLPAATVTASGETEPVGTAAEDAADDPAIWRNAADPAASLIVATDKKAGLHVYALDGKSVFFDPAGQLNNVDLATLPDGRVIVAASDRNDRANAAIRLYELDTSARRLIPLGTTPGGTGEAYGLCLTVRNGALHAFSVLKDGTVEEYRLDPTADGIGSGHLRTRKIASQAEGCVVDPRSGTLYVGEEARGVWRFGPESVDGELVAIADGKHIVADVEGLALMPEGETGGWLLVSSQGDNAYAVYRLPGMEFAGRFRIGEGSFGATQETDGIAVMGGGFGQTYPDGLFVAQDGDNRPYAQNFKLVSWSDIVKALPH